jgi:molecular chaperone HtpG
VLNELKKRAGKKPEEYATFWDNFGPVLKEGLYEDESQRETLIELARFASTWASGRDGGMVGLADYVARMAEGQDAIYYISGQDAETLRKSPQIEGFAAKGVEVLLMSDPVDEFWLPVVREYQGKAFKSVTRGGAELDKIAEAAKDEDAAAAEDAGAAGPGTDALIAFVKLALKDEVKDVRTSERLTDSAVCLVADEGDLDMHLERLLKQHNQIDQASLRILEINPRHALIRRLVAELETRGTSASAGAPDAADGDALSPLEEAAWLLLDQARILEGEPLPDPSAFARRLSGLVARGFGPESQE